MDVNRFLEQFISRECLLYHLYSLDIRLVTAGMTFQLSPVLFPAGSQVWVGGIFLKERGSWAWDTLIDRNTGEYTPFSSYANSLFSGGQPPRPTTQSMVYYTMIDKYTGRFDSGEPTAPRRFLCEVSLMKLQYFHITSKV